MTLIAERPISAAVNKGGDNFWAYHQTLDPLQSLITKEVSPMEVKGFVEGCGEALAAIVEIKPSHVFLPARGAIILGWSIYQIAGETNVALPNPYPLLVGNRRVVDENHLKTPIKPQKRRAAWAALTWCFPEGSSWPSNPVVIDEKVHGKSARQTASTVREFLLKRFPGFKRPVHLIALQYREPKIDAFDSFIHGRHGIMPQVIKAPNPFVDSKPFLDTIIEPDLPPNLDRQKAGMLMHVHNTGAESLIRSLTSLVISPELFGNFFGDLNSSPESSDPRIGFVTQQLRHMQDKTLKSDLINWFRELENVVTK